MKVWVLTEEFNLYDQRGEYLIEIFKEKPLPEQLSKILNCSFDFAKWLIETGGGRKNYEFNWYYLREMEPK